MRIRLLYILESALVIMILLFAACGTVLPDEDGRALSSSTQYSSLEMPLSDLQEDSGVMQSEISALHLVTSDIDYYPSKTAGNESGYYYIDRSGGISANLRYIDYATAQDIYLSSRPEANHLTPEDDSYISSVAGLGEVFPVEDSLFLLRAGASEYASQFGQDAMAAVFRMNLDGTDRKQIYFGKADEMLASTVAADDRYLYLISRRVEKIDGIPEQSGYLLRMDQQTGETTQLCRLSYNTWMIGATDGLLVFHNIEIDQDNKANPFSMMNEILVYEITSEKLVVVQKWPSEENATTLVCQNKLITASFSTRTVVVREIASGKETANYPLLEGLAENQTTFWFASCYDEHFLFWDYAAEKLRVLDLSTGKWSDVALTYKDPDKMELRPVEIYAENATHFLVCYDKQSITRHFSEWGSEIIYETQRIQPCYAIISKENYWNGVPNYLPVTFNE